ncbi:PaaI family thioesterase [Chloroflexota bacterium]
MTTWQEAVSEDPNMCFGCGRDNSIGLKLSFERDGHGVRTEFTPTELYQGWRGMVQGGIIATMLDEAASHAIMCDGMNPVTAKMEIRFRQPALIGEPLTLTGHVTRKTSRRVEARAAITDKDGRLIAESISTFVIVEAEPGGDVDAGR